jgi:hypothetical protein
MATPDTPLSAAPAQHHDFFNRTRKAAMSRNAVTWFEIPASTSTGRGFLTTHSHGLLRSHGRLRGKRRRAARIGIASPDPARAKALHALIGALGHRLAVITRARRIDITNRLDARRHQRSPLP